MSETRRDSGFGIRSSGLDARDSGFGIRGSGRTAPVDLDSAIDTVAREMTDAEPSGALRARVLERIEQGRHRTSAGVPRWAWAGAAAAVVLAVATAVWVVSPLRNQDAAQSTVAGQVAGSPPSAAPRPEHPAVQFAAVSTQSASPEGSSPAAARVRQAVAARGVGAAGDEAAEDLHAVPALAEIKPLRFAAVGPAPLHIADVEITQMTEVPSIEIPSLDPGPHDIQSADSKKEK